MRSKSAAERSKGEDKAQACVPGTRALPMPAALLLVLGAETRTARAMKPGLY